tara:strand:+ start:286 stop:426 length:141 start_codon:yes stop_codon:yes gene_type:complete
MVAVLVESMKQMEQLQLPILVAAEAVLVVKVVVIKQAVLVVQVSLF